MLVKERCMYTCLPLSLAFVSSIELLLCEEGSGGVASRLATRRSSLQKKMEDLIVTFLYNVRLFVHLFVCYFVNFKLPEQFFSYPAAVTIDIHCIVLALNGF
jgi:hypothetical protein